MRIISVLLPVRQLHSSTVPPLKRMQPAKIAKDLGSWPLWRLSLLFSLLHLVALGTFATGFLLTRIELPNRSAAADSFLCQACKVEPPVNKVIWMIIDALRWDFVSNSSRNSSVLGGMPILQEIATTAVGHTQTVICTTVTVARKSILSYAFISIMTLMMVLQGSAAMLTKFVADPPTTTMQRLKGLMTVTPLLGLVYSHHMQICAKNSHKPGCMQGGLPTFMDVGSSFSAAAVTEDNLIDQLRSHGKQLV